MIRKRNRKPDSTGSSLHDATARSTPPSDVLGLGRHLVHELGLESDGDPLSRWLVHHVAELIREAEAFSDAEQRRAAEDRAVETILKLWDHRRELPGRAYPLNEYQDAITALGRLRPESNPWTRLSQDPLQQGLSAVFDGLTNIVLAGILLTCGCGEASQDPQPSEAFLAEEETRLLTAIRGWTEFFHRLAERQSPRVVVITTEEGRAEANTRAAEEALLEKLEPKDQARHLLISCIEQMEPKLQQPKTELRGAMPSAEAPVPAKKRPRKSK